MLRSFYLQVQSAHTGTSGQPNHCEHQALDVDVVDANGNDECFEQRLICNWSHLIHMVTP